MKHMGNTICVHGTSDAQCDPSPRHLCQLRRSAHQTAAVLRCSYEFSQTSAMAGSIKSNNPRHLQPGYLPRRLWRSLAAPLLHDAAMLRRQELWQTLPAKKLLNTQALPAAEQVAGYCSQTCVGRLPGQLSQPKSLLHKRRLVECRGRTETAWLRLRPALVRSAGGQPMRQQRCRAATTNSARQASWPAKRHASQWPKAKLTAGGEEYFGQLRQLCWEPLALIK